jgi:lysozyme family protein
MALTTGQRDQVYRAYMRVVDTGEPAAFTKAQLRTAVDDADNWAESAGTAVPATSYNAALNSGFRTSATTAQKAAVLALVCWLRANRPLNEGL